MSDQWINQRSMNAVPNGREASLEAPVRPGPVPVFLEVQLLQVDRGGLYGSVPGGYRREATHLGAEHSVVEGHQVAVHASCTCEHRHSRYKDRYKDRYKESKEKGEFGSFELEYRGHCACRGI